MKYSERSAKARLSRNEIIIDKKSIEIPRDKHIGIRLWGAIDYLMNQHKYYWLFK